MRVEWPLREINGLLFTIQRNQMHYSIYTKLDARQYIFLMKTFPWTFPEVPLSLVEKLQHRKARLARELKVSEPSTDLCRDDAEFFVKWRERRKPGFRKFIDKQCLWIALLSAGVTLFALLLGYKDFAKAYCPGVLIGGVMSMLSLWNSNEKRFVAIQNRIGANRVGEDN